jgi:uncharacterized protein YjbI with pentapeptide repeats
MKNIQPLQLSLLTKNYAFEKRNHLVITSLLGFPLSVGRPLLEADLWTKLNDALGDSMLDMGMPKPNGEVLLYANYHSPEGKPVTAGRAVLQCGTVDKELAVIGNRYWRALIGPSKPEPFITMPLNYEHAFGGEKYHKNTLGMGMETVDVFGEQRMPLPNIEHPDKLMSSEGDRPEPAGFAPLDIMWQQRLKRAGTFDHKWIEQIAPGYPLDIDWNYFNCAPQDQWLEAFWKGNESYRLYNMHPDKAVIEGELPNFRARAFILPKGDESTGLKEVEQRLETIYFFPELDMGVLLWRGVVEVKEDDLSDIGALISAFEHADSESRPLDHYQQSYRNREDPALALKYMNNTEDLIPERVPCGYRYVTLTEDDMNMPMLENAFAGAEETKNELIQQAEQKKVELKAQLEGMADKLPPQEMEEKMAALNKPIDFPKFEVPSKADRLKIMEEEQLTERVDFSKLEGDIKGQIKDGKDQAREKLEEIHTNMKARGVDEEELAPIAEALKNLDLPPLLPRPFVDDIRVQLDQQLVDIEKQKQQILADGGDLSAFPEIDTDFDALFIQFKQLEAMQKDGYRLSAHNGELGRNPHTRSLIEVKQSFLEAFQNGESLKDRDFACIDLSNQDLTGIDLESAYLEQVNFTGAVLNNANLKNAILAGANLSGASIDSADLSGANLGKVNFSKTSLKNTNLKQAILDESRFHKTLFSRCDLSQTAITDASFSEVDFSHSTMNHFTVSEQDLSSCRFDHCQLNDASFTQCQLNHASFLEAILIKASFSQCQSVHANFHRANLENARFHEECGFTHANFSNAILLSAVFQYANLEDSKFDEAEFFMADFSRSNLQRASFHRAIGKKAQFVKSDLGGAKMTSMNLMEGTLMKARLTSADFADSNLYAVEFMDATVGGTNFSGTNLDMSKLQDWHPDG